MTDSIRLSGSDHVATVTVTEPHSLGFSFLQSLLKILTEKIDSPTRVLILTASHPEALLADVAPLKAMGPTEAMAFSAHSLAFGIISRGRPPQSAMKQ